VTTRVLHSAEDVSVNFVTDTADGGALEARYVRRRGDYFIVYLSSHTGCDKACRFCHLTQTKQTMMTPATLHGFAQQAGTVLDYYDTLEPVPTEFVNYNFMARGEPFENGSIFHNWTMVADALRTYARDRDLRPRFNVSTIMPGNMWRTPLREVFRDRDEGVSVYYSLYSMREAFRRRWLPKALDPHHALDKLAEWQIDQGREVVLHWAFIEGENDDVETVQEIIDAVKERGIDCRFNLVRYNPYSPAQGREPAEHVLKRNFEMLADAFTDTRSRIVPRVGMDVKASCGMFIERT